MSAELTVWQPPSAEAIRAMASPEVYALERLGEALVEGARAELDGRIAEWTQAGWSQRQIADEIGCDQSTVSRRQARLESVEGSSRRRSAF